MDRLEWRRAFATVAFTEHARRREGLSKRGGLCRDLRLTKTIRDALKCDLPPLAISLPLCFGGRVDRSRVRSTGEGEATFSTLLQVFQLRCASQMHRVTVHLIEPCPCGHAPLRKKPHRQLMSVYSTGSTTNAS